MLWQVMVFYEAQVFAQIFARIFAGEGVISFFLPGRRHHPHRQPPCHFLWGQQLKRQIVAEAATDVVADVVAGSWAWNHLHLLRGNNALHIAGTLPRLCDRQMIGHHGQVANIYPEPAGQCHGLLLLVRCFQNYCPVKARDDCCYCGHASGFYFGFDFCS